MREHNSLLTPAPEVEKTVYRFSGAFPDKVDLTTEWAWRLKIYLDGKLMGNLIEAERGEKGYVIVLIPESTGAVRVVRFSGVVTYEV